MFHSHGRSHRRRRRTAHTSRRRRDWAPTLSILFALILLAAVVWRERGKSAAAVVPVTPVAVTASVAPPPSVPLAFPHLVGEWQRPDGGYVIEVRSVDEQGALDLSYFNPRPVHVATARASRAGGATKIVIKLQDMNYPGSTYRLTYNAANDHLEGVYYQAVLRQSLAVVFVRKSAGEG